MPDCWMDVDTALTKVPVNILPLVGVDGLTIDAGVTYDEAGIDLNWNFVTTAGAYTQTNVVPTTAGVHDWTIAGNGMYTIEMPASGGTINNDTEGFGWFSGDTTATMPWRGPTIGFRNAELNNLEINKAQLNGLLWSGTVTANDTTVTMADEARANAIYVGARVLVLLVGGTNANGREYFGTVGASRVITLDPSFTTDSLVTPTGTITGAVYAIPKSTTSSLPAVTVPSLAAVLGALDDAAATGAVGDAKTGMSYLKQAITAILVQATAATTAQANLDTITGSDGVTLATAQGNYAPNTVVPDAAGVAPTATEIVDEFETQSQADPTGFHVNVMEVNSVDLTGDGSGTPMGAA